MFSFFQNSRRKKNIQIIMEKTEEEDAKVPSFKLSNITDAIVDVEKRNKTLDDALTEATQKLEQKSSQFNKMLCDEAELAIKKAKIKREIDLYETAHKDEMSRYFQKNSLNPRVILPFFLENSAESTHPQQARKF